MNCDDICMCVVNKQFELPKFVFDSVYVDLKYNEIFSLLLLGLCSHVVVLGMSVRCDACTVFVIDVCMLRECEGICNAGVWKEGRVVGMSAGHEYVGLWVVHVVHGLCLTQLLECVKCVCVGLRAVLEVRGVSGK